MWVGEHITCYRSLSEETFLKVLQNQGVRVTLGAGLFPGWNPGVAETGLVQTSDHSGKVLHSESAARLGLPSSSSASFPTRTISLLRSIIYLQILLTLDSQTQLSVENVSLHFKLNVSKAESSFFPKFLLSSSICRLP